jgi:hypothetical protein
MAARPIRCAGAGVEAVSFCMKLEVMENTEATPPGLSKRLLLRVLCDLSGLSFVR